MSIYLISTIVFLVVLLVLAVVLLALEAAVAPQGECKLSINQDPAKTLKARAGSSLLTALADNGIYLPSGCGGGGTCGLCKCKITSGGGELLPTERPHLSRAEKQAQVRLACQVKVRENLALELPAYIFDIKKYTATVVSNHNVATFIKELVVKVETATIPLFKAGGYMQIDIPAYALSFRDFSIAEPYRSLWQMQGLFDLAVCNDEPTFRAYSMANYPGEELFRFTVRLELPPAGTAYPAGIASSYLFSLQPGDKVALSGPFGEFFVKDTNREICFIGGGAGMAPMRSHILDLLHNKRSQRLITFWYGARSQLEMFYDTEFRELARKFSNFKYHVALSAPADGDDWDGSVGFIHDVASNLYLKQHAAPEDIEYYLCGPPLMLKAALTMLDSLGVEPAMITYDDFGAE